MNKFVSALLAAVFAALTISPVAFAADEKKDAKKEAKAEKKAEEKKADKK
jgi:hypothetical protein